jgi:hypothetical protein
MVAVLFAGFKGEVWLEPGAEPSQGALYRAKREGLGGQGGVCLVLGAGKCQAPGLAAGLPAWLALRRWEAAMHAPAHPPCVPPRPPAPGLRAGNQISVPILDVLHKLVAEDKVGGLLDGPGAWSPKAR